MGFINNWKIKRLTKKATELSSKRINSSCSDDEIRQEIIIHKKLINIYTKNLYNKKYPNAKFLLREGLRACANLNDIESQYHLGIIFLKEAQFWENMRHGIYKSEIYQTYQERCYNECVSFIKTSQNNGYFLSIRMMGIMTLKGYGVEKNEELGYKLIAESISKENSWDKVNIICKPLGLDSPDTLAKIYNYK